MQPVLALILNLKDALNLYAIVVVIKPIPPIAGHNAGSGI
jgi:hypothetical protein